ncbi:MAG: hypothetical protein P0S93_03525 [Candidatus Neptunochlamydia sp.]|nr:hypothetical protein [Candidatus Neptunochlamydia sp.]
MSIEIIGKPLRAIEVCLNLDSCMNTLTAEVAQEAIGTVHQTYMTYPYVCPLLRLGASCLLDDLKKGKPIKNLSPNSTQF